jgi:putative DNA primase/helicase
VLYIDGEMAAADMKKRLLLFGAVPPSLEIMQADQPGSFLPDLAYLDGQARLMASWGHPSWWCSTTYRAWPASRAATSTGWPAAGLIALRRSGTAVLMVHHANKEGEQRGTSRREDVLDLVMGLRRPSDYEPKDGARFELHFEKARGLFGAITDPIEAQLVTDEVGVARWDWRPAGAEQPRASPTCSRWG